MKWKNFGGTKEQGAAPEHVICSECGVLVSTFYAKHVAVRRSDYWRAGVRTYCKAHAPLYDETLEHGGSGHPAQFYARFEVDGRTGVPLGYSKNKRSSD